MTKYFALMVVFTLSLTSIYADDSTPQVNSKVQSYMDRAGAFVDTHSTDMGMTPDEVDTYKSTINGIGAAIPAKAEESNKTVDQYLADFNVDAYMNGLESKVNTMLNTFDSAKNSGTLKEEYLDEVATFFIKEYGEDMKNSIDDISTDDYLNDLNSLNSNYSSRLDSLNAPPSQNTIDFNPEEHLDRATGDNRRDTKIEFFWGGIQNNWLNYNMVGLVQAFQNNFSNDGVAQSNFQFLRDLWPQSAESYLMNTAYDDGQYYITDPDNPDARNGSVVVDEYGMGAADGSYDPDQFNVGNTTSLVVASYNNRTWGYTNGTFDLVSITTNGRRYTVQEHFYTSPLVLDMDGNGELQASNGRWLPHRFYQKTRMAEFDINGDDFIDVTEWVGPDDGLLIVTDGKEEVTANDLFGNAGGFDHGYEKLSLLDKNSDKQISGEELNTLSIWRDTDSNAKVDKGELSRVKDLGITMISLEYDNNLVSHFMQNGKPKKMFDWYPCLFAVKKQR